MMPSMPMISCVMPTKNRPDFARKAAACFLRQDYPNKELVVLDNSDDIVNGFLPFDDRIMYIYDPLPGKTLGEVRNVANSLASGELIAHWDDDDWSSPRRLSMQAEALQRTGADVSGFSTVLFASDDLSRAWCYCYPFKKPWLYCASMMYRRAAWQSVPFEAVAVGCATRWFWEHPELKLCGLPDTDVFVARVHRLNTSQKLTTTLGWQRIPLESLPRGFLDD